jgi:ATP-dependent RNA helicase DDX10/DBP4
VDDDLTALESEKHDLMSRKMKKKVKRLKIKSDALNPGKITFDDEGSAVKSTQMLEKEHLSKVFGNNGHADKQDGLYGAAELDAKIQKRIGEVTKKMLATNEEDRNIQKERLKEKHRKKKTKLKEKEEDKKRKKSDSAAVATLIMPNETAGDGDEYSDDGDDYSDDGDDNSDDNDDSSVHQSVQDKEDIALQLLQSRRR